ncbi:hypothetical protein J6590_073028 [Homalodisca vitripennis]|nr:hypothetical protein J6590_073028 [Homalodisca vitripennis]
MSVLNLWPHLTCFSELSGTFVDWNTRVYDVTTPTTCRPQKKCRKQNVTCKSPHRYIEFRGVTQTDADLNTNEWLAGERYILQAVNWGQPSRSLRVPNGFYFYLCSGGIYNLGVTTDASSPLIAQNSHALLCSLNRLTDAPSTSLLIAHTPSPMRCNNSRITLLIAHTPSPTRCNNSRTLIIAHPGRKVPSAILMPKPVPAISHLSANRSYPSRALQLNRSYPSSRRNNSRTSLLIAHTPSSCAATIVHSRLSANRSYADALHMSHLSANRSPKLVRCNNSRHLC